MSDEQRQPKRHRVVKSTVVDHSYTDLANSPFHKSDAKTLNFPAKLHEIVSTPSYQNIIGWLPHGRSWEVKNRELFISVVLTAHFNHNNFESFNRQVNFWGFKSLLDFKFLDSRWLTSHPSNSYHEAFLRSRPDLTHLVKRLKNGGKRIPDIAAEPNFYQMPFLPDTNQPVQQVRGPDPFVNIATVASAADLGVIFHNSTSMNNVNASQIPVVLPPLNNFQIMAMNPQILPAQIQMPHVANTITAQPLLQGTIQQVSNQLFMPNLGFQVAGASISHPQFTSNFATAIAQDTNDGSNQTSLAHAQVLERDQFCNMDQKPAAQPTAQLKQASTGGDGSSINDHEVTSQIFQGRLQTHVQSRVHELCQLSELKQNSLEASIVDSSSSEHIRSERNVGREVPSKPHAATKSEDCTNPTEGGARQSQSSHQSDKRISPTRIGQESVALANPPSHPVLEEFAETYLPFFSSSSESNDDKSK
ncbi:hypothetical protein ACHAWO_005801 [Cyclotella atomus]|uniref:HSF-type DNA-binding domain-containing protein n=1 Tax=Cyclotella atomus TaxID=382360 RepID=A0ABD3P289_9STRA